MKGYRNRKGSDQNWIYTRQMTINKKVSVFWSLALRGMWEGVAGRYGPVIVETEHKSHPGHWTRWMKPDVTVM